MHYGVCSAAASVSNDGRVAFIAPMEERADSVENGFHASYLSEGGRTTELLDGYERALAQSPLGVYRRTTNVKIAANREFTLFAAIVEFIKTGTTPPGSDVTVPVTLGTRLVVFDAKGNARSMELTSDKGSVSASQCHLLFADDGKLLVAAGQYLGLLLYASPNADLSSVQVLECGYTTGKAVITGDGSKVFFARKEGAARNICIYDTVSGAVMDTGCASSGLISDAQVSVSHDGTRMAFIRTTGVLVIASLQGGIWTETVLEAPQVRNPIVSSDGGHVLYQAKGHSFLQIYSYDFKTGFTRLISRSEAGVEADADCILPTISPDGSCVAFISAAGNLCAGTNGKPQVLTMDANGVPATLELHEGWNLCALPFVPNTQSLALLKNVGECFGWSGMHYYPLESFAAGQGFWIYSPTAKTLVLHGIDALPPPLQPGWNLILPSLYPQSTNKHCFEMNGKGYVRFDENASSLKTVWCFVEQ